MNCLLGFYLNKFMLISPKESEDHNNLRAGTLIPSPNIIKSFDITDIKNNILTIDGLVTHHPNIIYDKGSGLFNGSIRDAKIRVNLWHNLKIRNPDLYESQLADLTSVPHPTSKTLDKYKKFLIDHQLLINTIEVFIAEWRQLFKSVTGVPDDHPEYKLIVEWVNNLKRFLNFAKDVLDGGGSRDMSDERLAEYHQLLIDNISAMSSTGSLNPFQMIIPQELKSAKLDIVIFSNGKAFVGGIKFEELSVYMNNLNEKNSLGGICLDGCVLNKISMDNRCDIFLVKNTTINENPNINVYEVAYLDNVQCNEPITLDISNSEVLILKDTVISNIIYENINKMFGKHEPNFKRNIILYSFDGVKERGVYSPDYDQYINGSDKPPIFVEGSFLEMVRMNFEDDRIKQLLRKLNKNTIEDFVVYTDDEKMMKFIYDKTEGAKYKGVPAGMYYLLKKLLNK